MLHFSTKDQSAYQGAVRLVLNQGQDNNILILIQQPASTVLTA
ncbi:hypothetical protein SDC49_09335 [Lactobacillus sp. R2/2]|nr:hypothetical protein [Lactobacillus sp. R2/2]